MLKKNHLVLDDIAYDESLIDELTEANPQNYITQISVKFKKELEWALSYPLFFLYCCLLSFSVK